MDGNRIRWRCRRGMLELDAWLGDFYASSFAALPRAEQDSFVRLIGEDDLVILDWLTGQAPVPNELQSIVQCLRDRSNATKQAAKVDGT